MHHYTRSLSGDTICVQGGLALAVFRVFERRALAVSNMDAQASILHARPFFLSQTPVASPLPQPYLLLHILPERSREPGKT